MASETNWFNPLDENPAAEDEYYAAKRAATMTRKQSPFAAFPGKMREYHLLFADGRRTTYKPVWATDAGHATELYTTMLGDIEPVAYNLHVSSVRPIVAESHGTLRDIPA